jgi:glycosyltransferase involved in cell wall biosynthesis
MTAEPVRDRRLRAAAGADGLVSVDASRVQGREPVRLRLACVTPYVPHAALPHAGGVLLHHRLVAMSRGADVTVVAPRTNANLRAVEQTDAALQVVLLEPDPAPPLALTNAVALLRAAAGAPDSTVPRLRRAFRTGAPGAESLADQDVIEVHWGEYLPLLPVLRRSAPHAILGLFLHDILSEARAGRARNALVWRPERLAFALGGPAGRWRERRLLRDADLVFVLKEQDAAVLAQHGTTARTARPWLHLPDPVPGPVAEAVALFVGALWREENAEAAIWLVEQVWPLVRTQVPDARLRLVGDRPPPFLRTAAEGATGVEVSGYVEDLDVEYRSARIALAPLTTETGLKIKVPQAMAYGLPVVARPAAALGLAGAPRDVWGGVTDDPSAYAAHVVTLLQDLDLAAAIGRRAASWVLSEPGFDGDVAEALELYRAAAVRSR